VVAACLALASCATKVVVGHDEAPAADASGEPDVEPVRDAGADAANGLADASVRGPLSRLPWVSGAHYTHEPSGYEEFSAWRDRPVDIANLYVDRNSWQGLVSPGWPIDLFAPFEGTLVLSEPLYPAKLGNNKDCAAGAYDEQWRKLGTFLVEHERADTIIRLGWGHNDDTHHWRSDADPSDWIACFRRIVTAIRAGDRAVRIDWTFDAVASSSAGARDPYAAYPGDDYVDIVGMDHFDRYPPTRDEASFQSKCEGRFGLCRLAEFARAHKKQISVGEWGAVACGPDPGGDNPQYIRSMVRWFGENADILAYESYFDEAAGSVCSTLLGSELPNAAEAYKRLYAQP
jgi:hypothetical protein